MEVVRTCCDVYGGFWRFAAELVRLSAEAG